MRPTRGSRPADDAVHECPRRARLRIAGAGCRLAIGRRGRWIRAARVAEREEIVAAMIGHRRRFAWRTGVEFGRRRVGIARARATVNTLVFVSAGDRRAADASGFSAREGAELAIVLDGARAIRVRRGARKGRYDRGDHDEKRSSSDQAHMRNIIQRCGRVL